MMLIDRMVQGNLMESYNNQLRVSKAEVGRRKQIARSYMGKVWIQSCMKI